ncbi:MAG: hypothetical protein MIO90_03680 [Methanomassiliicoccales archaeon]|nr:hypothetical protein [Methanomassiliicoccales archaeon]
MEMADAPDLGQFNPRTMKMAAFCDQTCTACKLSRKKESGFWHAFVKLEAKLCPMCRAYSKVYGVPAYAPRPKD